MINCKQLLLISLSFLYFQLASAQENNQKLANISQQQFDSLYHAMMTEKYPEYADWKKGLPKRKRKVFLKHSITSFFVGSLLGISLSSTGSAFCQTIEVAISPLVAPEPQACKPKIAKAILITGSLGLLVGITSSSVKNKKISRFRPTISY